MLTWKPEFATGSPLIDGQHKILIDKINKLELLVASPSISKIDADLLIEFLSSYTVSHFKFEEQCMAQHHCPAHAQNKEAHDQFLKVVSQFKVEYAAKGASKEILGKLHQLVSSWIQNHILKIDIQLKGCIK